VDRILSRNSCDVVAAVSVIASFQNGAVTDQPRIGRVAKYSAITGAAGDNRPSARFDSGIKGQSTAYRPCTSTDRVRDVGRPCRWQVDLRVSASNAQRRPGPAPGATSHAPNDAAAQYIETASASSFSGWEATVRWPHCPRGFRSNSHSVSKLRSASRYRRATVERWRQQGVGRFLEGNVPCARS
jgi:hypothetical protein